jgi:hypothetical protein
VKARIEIIGNVTFAFAGGWKGMAVCSMHDKRDPAMGGAVALLKARPRFNEAAKHCINNIEELFPRLADRNRSQEFLRNLLSTYEIELTDHEVMSYCMIRAELSNRIKEASKITGEYDDDYNITRRRRGPDNAFIVEDCARKLVKACPSLARLG